MATCSCMDSRDPRLSSPPDAVAGPPTPAAGKTLSLRSGAAEFTYARVNVRVSPPIVGFTRPRRLYIRFLFVSSELGFGFLPAPPRGEAVAFGSRFLQLQRHARHKNGLRIPSEAAQTARSCLEERDKGAMGTRSQLLRQRAQSPSCPGPRVRGCGNGTRSRRCPVRGSPRVPVPVGTE
jgi:hypothetical protein